MPIDIRTGQTSIPAVRGLSPDAAEGALLEADLAFAYGASQYSAEYGVGKIMALDAVEGADADPGTVVTLIVSLGPQPVSGRFTPSIAPRRLRRSAYL